jgi:hypothetical protein
MSRREINLIGGFYKDSSLPWSAQDTVNWLPVPASEGGTRSPMKLRGAPGLRSLTLDVVPFGSGDWVAFGPGYAVITDDSFNWDKPKQAVDNGWIGGGAGFSSGVLIAAANNLGEDAQRSLNRGLSYAPISFPLSPNPDNNRRIDKFGSRWFLGTPSGGTLYSDNDGATWTLSSSPDATTATTHSRWQAAGAIYGHANEQQLIRVSNDNGMTWAYVQNGGSNALIGRTSTTVVRCGQACIAFSNQSGFRNVVRRSTNNCVTWSADIALPSGADSRFEPRCVEVSGATVVAVNGAGQIVYSEDQGASWSLASYVFPQVPRFIIWAFNRWTIVGDSGAIAVSVGGPNSFAAVPSGSFATDNITSIAFMPRNG